jgi:hypothetical protein
MIPVPAEAVRSISSAAAGNKSFQQSLKTGIRKKKMAILLINGNRKGYGHFMSKAKKVDLKNLEPEEQLKYEIAEELGLLDKVVAEGWKSLSAKETGRIGGLMTKKKKEMQAKLQKEDEERELLIEELL